MNEKRRMHNTTPSSRRPLIVALLDPLDLVVLGTAIAAGYYITWWLLPIGLLLWLIMVIEVARDPGKRNGQRVESAPSAGNESGASHADRTTAGDPSAPLGAETRAGCTSNHSRKRT